MKRAENRRPRRVPRTSEEVNEFITFRKRKERLALLTFKKTFVFKFLNSWNVLCIFIFLEILFCFIGPCHYQTHYTYGVGSKFGRDYSSNGKVIVSEVDLYALDGNTYKIIVNEFIEVPPKFTLFKIGKDFVMQKKLKVVLTNSDQTFRLFMASPVIFLSFFLTFISFVAYHFNLNENLYSLSGLASLNTLTLIGIFFY